MTCSTVCFAILPSCFVSKSNIRPGPIHGGQVILAHAMLKFGSEAIERGYLPKSVTRGMERAVERAQGFLIGEAKAVTGDDLKSVARVAADGDEQVASFVIEAVKKVGKDGVIAIEEAAGAESVLEIVEGMHFDRGYLSEHFVNALERQECVLEDCYILIHERRISSMKLLLPILEQVARIGKPLLVIAEDVEGEALSTLVVNKLRASLSCCAVKAPGHADRRKAVLEDIAVFTGGKAFTEELGLSLENMRLEDLGRAKKAIVDKDDTTLVGGAGRPESVDSRAKAIRTLFQETHSPYDKEKLQERLANLVGGIAVLKAGGVTSSDVRHQKYKMQSAVSAVISGIEEGRVLGGGQTLFRASRMLSRLPEHDEPMSEGVRAVSLALRQPLVVLIENSKRSITHLLAELEKGQDETRGFDARSGNLANLEKLGVFDSVKALRTAIGVAFAHARTILETGAWDLSQPEKAEV